MIYVIRASATEYVKIGIAGNPVSRMRELQTAQPTKLVLLATADWPDSDERRIHRCLRQHRALGEWFVMCQDIDRLILFMQRGDANARSWLTTLASPPRLAKVLNMAR